jgi:glycosyltransferase involved in cell wall biosynthesis
MKISLIVPTYNRTDNTRTFLKYILKFHQDDLYEIIFTDDGSSEDQFSAICEFKDGLKIPCQLVMQEDRGFRLARARNNGAYCASGDYLCFLDQDLIPSPGYFRWIKHFARPYRFLLTRTLYTTPEQKELIIKEVEEDYLLQLRHLGRKYLRKVVIKDYFYYLGKLIKLGDRRPKLKGGAFSLFKDKFELVNGFDETFVGWGREDDDLGRRLYLLGVIGLNISHKAWTHHLWHQPAPSKQVSPNIQRIKSKLFNRQNMAPEHGFKEDRGEEVKVFRIK